MACTQSARSEDQEVFRLLLGSMALTAASLDLPGALPRAAEVALPESGVQERLLRPLGHFEPFFPTELKPNEDGLGGSRVAKPESRSFRFIQLIKGVDCADGSPGLWVSDFPRCRFLRLRIYNFGPGRFPHLVSVCAFAVFARKSYCSNSHALKSFPCVVLPLGAARRVWHRPRTPCAWHTTRPTLKGTMAQEFQAKGSIESGQLSSKLSDTWLLLCS